MAASGVRSGFMDPIRSPKKAKTDFGGVATQHGRFTVVTYSRLLRVLIVEDDDAQRSTLTSMIDDLDIPTRIFEVMNGREAVDRCERRNYDVIFMDLDMPVLDGIHATREIRSIGFTEPIIGMLSEAAASDGARVDEFQASGLTECDNKPIDSDELERILIEAWNNGN